MKRSLLSSVICALALSLGACASSSSPEVQRAPGTTGVQTDAVRRALAEDTYAAEVRDQQSEGNPPAQAVAAYVQRLDEIELEHAPADFVAAMRAHRDAWEAIIGPLQAFPNERGDLHRVFDRLKAMPAPTGPEFQSLINNIVQTWTPVEQAAKRAGVDLM